MKKILILFLILVASHFGITQVFAQKKAKPREVIVIEITVPDFDDTDKREVLINRTSKSKYVAGGGGGKASSGTLGCPKCSAEELAKLNAEQKKSALNEISSYSFTARAWRMGRDKSKMSFEILAGENCQAKKVFMVYRNRQNKIQLDCGVSLTAYYGLESKEAN